MLTIAGHSLLQQAAITGDYLLVLLMPFPLWGPLLAAATFGYWLRRRSDATPDGVPPSSPIGHPSRWTVKALATRRRP